MTQQQHIISRKLNMLELSKTLGNISQACRKKLYGSLEEIQADLDEFMAYYNGERTNQGRYCQGRTPRQTFIDGLPVYQKYVFEKEVVENEAA